MPFLLGLLVAIILSYYLSSLPCSQCMTLLPAAAAAALAVAGRAACACADGRSAPLLQPRGAMTSVVEVETALRTAYGPPRCFNYQYFVRQNPVH